MTTLDPRLGLATGVSMSLSHGVPPIDVMHHGGDRYSVRCGDLTIHSTDELLQQLVLDLGDAIHAATGFTDPTTVIASELDDSWVGHQFRLCLPPLSDGTVPYTAWADIERLSPSPIGWCVEVYAADVAYEVDLNDAVQVRRRLSLAEINEQPKAVA